MLKKEISDVLKHTAIFIIYLFALPAFLVFTKIIVPELQPYFSVFFPIFQFSLFFWAFFMGTTLFSVERGQRGMEYLLSLPYSRYQIVGMKILPRFIAVLFFYVVFIILYTSGGEDLVALSFISFTFIYFSLYLISLSLSAISENFLVLFVSSLFSLFIYLNLLPLIFWLAVWAKGAPFRLIDIRLFFTAEWDPEVTVLAYFSAFVLLLPLLISFGLSIKKLDIRPAKVYNKRFFKLFAPIFLGGLIFSFLFAQWSIITGYSYSFYLTEDHKLIESTRFSGIKIYDGDKVHKVKDDIHFWWPVYEEKEYVYDRYYDKIIRMNKSDYTFEILYEAPPGRYIRGPTWKYERTFAFEESNYGYRKTRRLEKKLVLLDETSRSAIKLPLDVEPLNNYYIHNIFGVDRIDGQRFWLLVTWRSREERHIFRLWEDGKIEHVGMSVKWPFYINDMLLTYSEEEVIINREKDGKYVPVRRIPNPEGYRFGLDYYYRMKLDDMPVKELWGRRTASPEDPEKGPSYARLNLEDFKIQIIGNTRGRMDYHDPDNLYFIESAPIEAEVRIYKYEDGQVQLFKTFKGFDVREPKNRLFTFKSGIVLRRGKKVKVYAFPDLREIKFKKL